VNLSINNKPMVFSRPVSLGIHSSVAINLPSDSCGLGESIGLGTWFFLRWPGLAWLDQQPQLANLVMTNIAMVEPWPIEINGFPINSMVIFHD